MEALKDLWEEFLEYDGPKHVAIGALYLVLCWGAGRILRALAARARAKGDAAERSSAMDVFIASERGLEHALLLFGLWLFVARLPMLDRSRVIANGFLYVAIAIAVTRAAAAGVRALIDGWSRRVARRVEGTADVSVFSLLRKLGMLVTWTVGAMIVLDHFRIDVMSLATALGVGSLAIGLAARETLGNMISGFTLLIDRPFREGDRIKLATAELGDVREIGLRSTRIQLLDGTYLIVPNNELVNSRVVNLTWPVTRGLAKVALQLAYGTDVARAKALLVDVARAHEEALVEPAPTADVVALGDSGLAVELSTWVRDPRRAFAVAEALRVAAELALRDAGVEVALPARRIHVQGAAGALAGGKV